MSGVHRTKIEWCDASWNPVTGCLHGCRYCYAETMTHRFKPKHDEWPEPGGIHVAAHDDRCYIATKACALRDADGKYLRSTPYPKGFAPTMHTYKLDHLTHATTPRRIFVGSMTDLFGEWVPDEWLAAIFRACHEAPQHAYLFLTKNPQRYTELAEKGLLPDGDNYWYGSTATTPETPFWFSDKHNTFVSIEPILAPFEEDGASALAKVNWVILGAETGPRKSKVAPDPQWIENIIQATRDGGTPLFMKDSKELTAVWKQPLIQETPPGLIRTGSDLPRCRECEHREETQQGKRGTSIACAIGWDAEGYDDRGSRHVSGRYTRTSPPWCPLREEEQG